jgi:hypothetical protein
MIFAADKPERPAREVENEGHLEASIGAKRESIAF